MCDLFAGVCVTPALLLLTLGARASGMQIWAQIWVQIWQSLERVLVQATKASIQLGPAVQKLVVKVGKHRSPV